MQSVLQYAGLIGWPREEPKNMKGKSHILGKECAEKYPVRMSKILK